MYAPPESKGLRLLGQNELTAGAVLPGHIRDRAGRVLVPSGQQLDQTRLDTLRDRTMGMLYAGEDWPTANSASPGVDPEPASAGELTAAQLRRSGVHPDRVRRHARHEWSVELRLSIEERSPEGCRQREVLVTTGDISLGGFSFFYRHYIHPGTTISARFETLTGQPHLTAIVRHCAHVSDRQHRIGAEFVAVERSADPLSD